MPHFSPRCLALIVTLLLMCIRVPQTLAEDKLPVPDAAALTQATKLVSEVYKDEIDKAKKPEEKLALAKKLSESASGNKDDATGHYVLYTTARDLACDAGDTKTAMDAVNALAELYEFDAFAMKIESLNRLAKSLKLPAQRKDLVEAADEIADAAIMADRYDQAEQVGNIGLRVARQTNDQALIAQGTATVRNATEMKTAHAKLKAALGTLENKPSDPEANFTVGKFYCFIKGDWEKGLPMLVLSGDAELKPLAEKEAKNVTETSEQVAIGDGWWAAAEKATGTAQRNLRAHATKWYEGASVKATGLVKTKIDKRIQMSGTAAKPPAVAKPDLSKVGRTATNSIGMKLAYIPAGQFVMGSPENEPGRGKNETQHKVTITKPYLMGVTEVTQSQWKAVMGNNPSVFAGKDDWPVDNMSWEEAVEFCRKLSEKEKREYRLPTAAEWEYACRAGTTTQYNTGDGETSLAKAGWYTKNSKSVDHPVGQKQPNAWGLYDMHGGAEEWCADWFGEMPADDAVDPTGPTSGRYRALRGGSWILPASSCRSANQNSGTGHASYWGFRVMCVIDAVEAK